MLVRGSGHLTILMILKNWAILRTSVSSPAPELARTRAMLT